METTDVDYDLPSDDHEVRVKIILLGDSAVGKSKSVVNAKAFLILQWFFCLSMASIRGFSISSRSEIEK